MNFNRNKLLVLRYGANNTPQLTPRALCFFIRLELRWRIRVTLQVIYKTTGQLSVDVKLTQIRLGGIAQNDNSGVFVQTLSNYFHF
ncbi:MAG: hypothetical protein ACE5HI_00280 [bacterium]